MATTIPYHNSLYRLAQIGTATGMQLVRIVNMTEGNKYTARAIEFDTQGATQFAEITNITVTNLAEPADLPGVIPSNTDAIALDIEGRWIVFLHPSQSMASFPAKVISSQGSAIYTLREQILTAQGSFIDKAGATDLSARNLAELSLGPGAAVDIGTIVFTNTIFDNQNPPSMAYVFDHPAYAKYLD